MIRWTPPQKLGEISEVSTRFISLSIENGQADAGRDCRNLLARDRIFRREWGQRNIHFLYSADHGQDWQSYPVDPYSCNIY